MRPSILIVNRSQFGYHVDTFKYCTYLNAEFDITYIGWDQGKPKVEMRNVSVKYIKKRGNKIMRYIIFFSALNREIRRGKYDFIFMVYFFSCSILKALNSNDVFNLDVRSNSIRKYWVIRAFNDLLLRLECLFFKNKTIVGLGLADSLKLKKIHCLPLGGECFSVKPKFFEKLHLLYVGTLEHRNVLDCIKGLHKYLSEKTAVKIPHLEFTIIGDGPGNELKEINDYILKNDLTAYVKTLGYIHTDNLHYYFELANIGVSYVPITEYFNNQPPTKTYEYILSGLPTIATKTRENIKVVNEKCGVLIDDTPDSFLNGLKTIIRSSAYFDTETIKAMYAQNLWRNICLHNLKPYIERVIAASRS